MCTGISEFDLVYMLLLPEGNVGTRMHCGWGIKPIKTFDGFGNFLLVNIWSYFPWVRHVFVYCLPQHH